MKKEERPVVKSSFKLVFEDGGTKATGIECLKCRRISTHPDDITTRYCGSCHQFHQDIAKELFDELQYN